MNAKQCRMARAGVGWGAQELATSAGVSYPTVHRFESGGVIADESREKLVEALLEAGAQFSRRAGRICVTVPE